MTLTWEQRGKAIVRRAIISAVICTATAPVMPLVISTFGQESARAVWTDAFGRSLRTSLWLASGVSLISLAIGLPLGILAGLYRFPGRRLLLLFQALPLLLPSFLPSIGWSNLASAPWGSWPSMVDGFAGCVFVLGLQMVPLPLLATWAACRNLTASQIDAARLHGGETCVLKYAGGACLPVAILTALLGGILSLSDPGAPLIFGCPAVVVEIRTSFSALFDYELAGRQCLLLAGFVLLLTIPLVLFGLRRLASAVLARQTRAPEPHFHRALSGTAMTGLLLLLVVGVLLPFLGLCRPAADNPMMDRAGEKVGDTAMATFVFAGGAAGIATLLATAVALAASESPRARQMTLAIFMLLLAMPPALGAIGMMRIATHSPPQLDWLTRSRFTVALILGLRFLPVATVAMMRAVGSLSPSWMDAGRIHGVSFMRLFVRVIAPNLAPAFIVSLLLVMVLAAADITTTHLLQPPGSQSLPVAIFTVMANSPEGLVASLCLLYMLCVVLLLAAASQLPRLWSRRLV